MYYQSEHIFFVYVFFIRNYIICKTVNQGPIPDFINISGPVKIVNV